MPLILLCVKNQWAISTPLHQQTAATSLADRAVGYGMPGVSIDGNDAAAVFDAVDEARRLALDGGGPTLIEATVYRLGAHTTADDPSRYVPAEDLKAARANDPVHRLANHLGDLGLWDDDSQAKVEAAALTRIEDAYNMAMAQPLAADAVLDHCFSTDTPRMARQRAALLSAVPHGHSDTFEVDS